MTLRRLLTLVVLLVALPALSRSADGWSYRACINGTPCREVEKTATEGAARPARPCCRSALGCPPTTGPRCVIRTVPPADAVVPTSDRLPARVAVVAVVEPAGLSPTMPSVRPPAVDPAFDRYWREPDLGHGPRPPPRAA